MDTTGWSPLPFAEDDQFDLDDGELINPPDLKRGRMGNRNLVKDQVESTHANGSSSTCSSNHTRSTTKVGAGNPFTGVTCKDLKSNENNSYLVGPKWHSGPKPGGHDGLTGHENIPCALPAMAATHTLPFREEVWSSHKPAEYSIASPACPGSVASMSDMAEILEASLEVNRLEAEAASAELAEVAARKKEKQALALTARARLDLLRQRNGSNSNRSRSQNGATVEPRTRGLTPEPGSYDRVQPT